MEKTKPSLKRQLKKQWEMACNGYLVELLRMWELDAYYGCWIGDAVGGIYDYGYGSFTIGIHDLIYCVDHEVTYEKYTEWIDYCCNAAEFGFDTPNLHAWLRGCPRTSSETFKKLRKMKAEVNDAINEEKERVNNEKNGKEEK